MAARSGRDLTDEVRIAPDKSHVHDHFAQADELAKAAAKLKEDSYPKVPSGKRFGKLFIEESQKPRSKRIEESAVLAASGRESFA